MQESAGLLIIKDNKILLCHPTGSNWYATYSIPKGLIDKDEDKISAAIRETFEEIGIIIDSSKIDKTEHIINYYKKGVIFKKVYYFITDGNDINFDIIPKRNLIPNPEGILEIDWAGFLNKEESEERIFWRFKEMLEYI
jgi:predicted NUDIX family NTP pyrophosphohydrolase